MTSSALAEWTAMLRAASAEADRERDEPDLRPVEGREADAELAAFAKALGHPARVRIVRLLARRDGRGCGELVEALGLGQSTVSQHLAVLKDAGIVDFDVRGPRNLYRVEPRLLRRLKALVGAL